MRAPLLAILLGLAACDARSAPQAAPSNNAALAQDSGAANSCGAAADASEATMCGPDPMTSAQRREEEARAGRGDVQAMLALAVEAESPADQRRWYEQAASRGNCHAVRMLRDSAIEDGRSAAERRRWDEADRRLGCSTLRWTAAADGSLTYAEPDDFLFRMWVGCVNGRVRITGPAAATPHDYPKMYFRTAGGEFVRGTMRTDGGGAAVLAFDAAPEDAVLAGLLRGERIEARHCPDCPPWSIDSRTAREPMRRLVRQCTGASG